MRSIEQFSIIKHNITSFSISLKTFFGYSRNIVTGGECLFFGANLPEICAQLLMSSPFTVFNIFWPLNQVFHASQPKCKRNNWNINSPGLMPYICLITLFENLVSNQYRPKSCLLCILEGLSMSLFLVTISSSFFAEAWIRALSFDQQILLWPCRDWFSIV